MAQSPATNTDPDVTPSAPVPARAQRRTDTTTHPAPQAHNNGPEDLDAPEGRLPHERDEAAAMTGGIPSPRVEQGFQDLQRGLEDTDQGLRAHRVGQKPIRSDATK
ncbi:conserved hypothetical protein [Acidovorax delafieldii 2AN]|uniref:Uncharacterized protein n=1 Tax=Acidovorax delafieldii 2AN TaxID=573060 RepID=C5TB23_ACIDE|nr:hypothetical protein [Acidovorax delafieldii]EER58326.1 conserved hypothetical protein [Acidovorax delafieldii 2AN]